MMRFLMQVYNSMPKRGGSAKTRSISPGFSAFHFHFPAHSPFVKEIRTIF